MCAQFVLQAKISEVVKALEQAAVTAHLQGRWSERLESLRLQAEDLQREFSSDWKPRTLPYYRSPVLRSEPDRVRMDLLQFSLVPAWSKEKRVKFATHNARLFTHDEKTGKDTWIHEKPTWKAAFQRRHCIVPMTGFFEAVYEGPHAGHMIQFVPENDGNLLFAGGLWEEWHSKTTGEVIESFTILTDDPIDYVKENGHDRSPIFLRPDRALEWLDYYPSRAEESIAFLRSSKADLHLRVIRDRELKSAAKKRA